MTDAGDVSPVTERPEPGETLDSVCGVQILQPKKGYRFNLDPILLAHFAAQAPLAGPAVDLGSGSGIIPLILAHKFGWDQLTALELLPALHALSERNVRLNRLEHQVTPVLGDIRTVKDHLPPGRFAQVLCNPPYGLMRAGRVAVDLDKAMATHELTCSLEDVVRAGNYLLAPRGALHLILPVARLEELLFWLREKRLKARSLRLVHARADRPARLLLLRAQKGAKGPLWALPPLVLHRAGAQAFSEEVEEMLKPPPSA